MMEKSYNERFALFDENYPRILEEIAVAAERSGRRPEEITLLAATKTVPLEVINHAIDKGLSCMGENRVQELLEKYDGLHKDRCDVQFIGQLQTNKVKYLIGKVSCIQSVGSVKLAREISRLCVKENTSMDVLVEVNIGREESKGGVLPEALLECVDEIRELPGIHVRGLMAIPPICENSAELCGYFSAVRQSYVDIAAKKLDNVRMDCLSMGMSSDFAEAIACGATMVRVGSSLFGKREYPNH
jgi:pyridoxal phosphate enzyme (YggS family)